ncbi:hypothetical protein AAP_04986 [Ascosphaera apis ARSEF 7405]|uniref:Uncharacterized protein n=1 Tax=Ascosphaera apis ARSEF 7405 TaxID=392613 RepID=A0A167W553_9EURO|nr:hypothetical protein AAP_04986 [Ascosphaera apis ARSEF 7405]
MHGACANCHWSAAGDRCSIRDDAHLRGLKRSAPDTPTGRKRSRQFAPDFNMMARDIRKNTKALTPPTREQLGTTNLEEVSLLMRDSLRMYEYFKARHGFLDELARKQVVIISESEDEKEKKEGEGEGEGEEEEMDQD